MPELPEVESIARTLRPLIAGREVRGCRVLHAIAARPQSEAFLRGHAVGRKVADVRRRGKYLILELGDGCVVLHFRLDGQLVWFPGGDVRGHVDVALEFAHGTLGFVDRRHFGRVHWHKQPEDIPGIARLGVEPLSPEFTPRRLAQELAGRRQPLKLLLLNQTRIAGLGNIYSAESLWRARLSPFRRAHRLTARETRRLHKAIVGVLERALECCLNPAPHFEDPQWWFQGLERMLGVYGREGKPCRRCGRAVRRAEQGGRSTFFCPSCQPGRSAKNGKQ